MSPQRGIVALDHHRTGRGAVSHCLPIGGIVAAAWRGRLGVRSVLPLSLVLISLFFGFKGGSLGAKVTWVVFAYALTAGGSPAPSRRTPIDPATRRMDAPDAAKWGTKR